MDLKRKEQIEIEYWKNSRTEAPGRFSRSNFINKSQECLNLDYKINKHWSIIKDKKRILEIGGGQGWASCYIKRFCIPKAHFTVTDISPHALESLVFWENIFDVKIDHAFPAKSYDIDAPDGSYDLIFCYAAAHHFVEYEKTLKELYRILSDGGYVVWLYEPTSSRLFYRLHHYYVNRMPHHTPEDVIIPSRIQKISNRIGFEYVNHYDPHQKIIRSLSTGFYFNILKWVPFLKKIMPGSSDLIFSKK